MILEGVTPSWDYHGWIWDWTQLRYPYKLLGFWVVGVKISLPYSCLVCTFSCLLKLPFANLEWSTPLFSHSLPFMHDGEFGNEHIFTYIYFIPYMSFDRFSILYLTFNLLGLMYFFSIPGCPTFFPLFSTPWNIRWIIDTTCKPNLSLSLNW